MSSVKFGREWRGDGLMMGDWPHKVDAMVGTSLSRHSGSDLSSSKLEATLVPLLVNRCCILQRQ